PIAQVTFGSGDLVLTGSVASIDGVVGQYCVRRTVLDSILVGAAVEAGAELRERFVMEDVLLEGGRVTGIQGRGPGGAAESERARLVVGADGLNSGVARSVEARSYAERPPLTCVSYAYWRGVSVDDAQFHLGDGRAVSAFPTNDDLTCIAVAWPAQEARAFRADVEGNYHATLALAPALANAVRPEARHGHFVTTADLPTFFRRPHGPGWALVGDAGHHKDPLLAQGIADAFRDAELLAGAIDDGFSARRELTEALADYEARRNRAAMPAHRLATVLARLRLPAGLRRLLRDQAGDQEAIDRFLAVMAGTFPADEFFPPESLAVPSPTLRADAAGADERSPLESRRCIR
ncbi:MAG: NAD(P)/FAD-dependent oxidoreductase, partial [Acidimicrobiia bacterium]